MQKEGKDVSRVNLHSHAVDPEAIPSSNPDHDEAVLARFGKRQQLRVSVSFVVDAQRNGG